MITNRANLNISDASVAKLGKALRKHGYNRIMRNNSYVYAVNFLDYDIVHHKNKDSGEPPKPTEKQSEIPYRFSN